MQDPDWDRDESVKAWVLTIVDRLGFIDDQKVIAGAKALKHKLPSDDSLTTRHPYPLRSRLPTPATSSILATLQDIPYLEYELYKLRHQLRTEDKRGGSIPLPIYLPVIEDPQHDMVNKQLQSHNFDEYQIMELKLNRQLVSVLTCDGYDEIQQLVNLYKATVSTSLYRLKLQSNDQHILAPQSVFHKAVIAPFTAQIQDYVELYVPLEPRT
ncbi:hypothetical protein BGX30_011690 [Mortierella sp. GBA39]|nr:hypothetical protein BGX30_011690 [Mortierella sp. GBA39]